MGVSFRRTGVLPCGRAMSRAVDRALQAASVAAVDPLLGELLGPEPRTVCDLLAAPVH